MKNQPNPAKASKDRIKAKALREYRRGCKLQDIATRYHKSVATISLWAKEAGIVRRRPGCRKKRWPSEIDIAVVNAVKQVVDGKPTLTEIGAKWRMSRANVHRIFHRWKNWKPVNPFAVGDKIRLLDRDYEVLEPDIFRGTVRDLKSGEIKRIVWRMGKQMAVKL